MLETVNHSFAVSQGTHLYIATGSTTDIPVLPRWKSSFFATRSGFHSKSAQFQLSKFLQQEELKKNDYTDDNISKYFYKLVTVKQGKPKCTLDTMPPGTLGPCRTSAPSN